MAPVKLRFMIGFKEKVLPGAIVLNSDAEGIRDWRKKKKKEKKQPSKKCLIDTSYSLRLKEYKTSPATMCGNAVCL